MRLTTLRADLLLLAAAVIWGSGFVAQRLGSEHLDAFEYNGLRFTLGTLLLLPMLRFAPWPAHASRADARRATVRGGVLAGCAMVLAANAQQHGLGSTTALTASSLLARTSATIGAGAGANFAALSSRLPTISAMPTGSTRSSTGSARRPRRTAPSSRACTSCSCRSSRCSRRGRGWAGRCGAASRSRARDSC